jgi:hypothetical protein
MKVLIYRKYQFAPGFNIYFIVNGYILVLSYLTVQIWIKLFSDISISTSFNPRNFLPKYGRFLLKHSGYHPIYDKEYTV